MYKSYSWVIFPAAVLLTACDKPSDKAKREYRMMVKGGASLEDQCRKKREIAAAYLAEENEEEYPMAKLEADVRCHESALQRMGE
ncbi:hypothetical protein [Sphingomonas sp.]|jgi:hypothetical protein|uniref:hypothetical protein n=1 Tax=Sphingomonas sp. TaxID=28214 RepID=UPI0018468A97|nr:hypothetical protein [Sphingomonas sp.]MBA3512301.1 hypothetical protein [Sphingomonas sp.]